MAGLPPSLDEIAQDFAALSARDRLTMLVDFSDELPDLPERYRGHAELLERVEECQSPLYLVVEVEGAQGSGIATVVSETNTAVSETTTAVSETATAVSVTAQGATVRLFFQAPPEAPTTRGFAGILHEGLDGLTVAEVLDVPDDAPYHLGLGEAVSPLRLRGMMAMLSRIKRQVRAKSNG